MSQLVVSPDVEGMAVAALNAEFEVRMPGVTWGTKIPRERPAKFGRLMLSGGTEETMITDQVQLIVEGWAEGVTAEKDAGDITRLGVAALKALDGILYGGFTIGHPANLPDPVTSQTRYTALVGVRVRGTVLA